MQINADRIAHDIETIASFNDGDAAAGFSRPTFSPAWRKARDYVMEEARRTGASVWVDAAGNVHARAAGRRMDERLWLSGSHIDSVPTGGKYDGVIGVVAALEVLRAAPTSPLELIIFAEEEGTTFNLGMLGSRAWAGTLSMERLAELKNKAGKNVFEAGAPHGVNPNRLIPERLNPNVYKGLIELHIEQGPGMWKNDVAVAVVTAINGRRQYTCALTGTANHAGSTKMKDRADALAAAAEILVALEALGAELDAELDHTVITVGRMHVEPNALNVIPGCATFHIDFRARADAMIAAGEKRIETLIASISQRRHIASTLQCTEALPPVPMAGALCQRLRDAARRLGVTNFPDVASGALHDSAILAPLLPAAMLFIASKGGISHNPDEFSRIGDITLATRILAEAVRE